MILIYKKFNNDFVEITNDEYQVNNNKAAMLDREDILLDIEQENITLHISVDRLRIFGESGSIQQLDKYDILSELVQSLNQVENKTIEAGKFSITIVDVKGQDYILECDVYGIKIEVVLKQAE